MSSWVLSCNPQVYSHATSFRQNGFIDWVTVNRFEDGDIIYIYEVIPPRGRGAIVYKAEVAEVGLTLDNKTDDHVFWKDGVYPKDYSAYKFCRLKLISEKDDDSLSLESLRKHGFSAPQGFAYLLDNKPSLLKYIQNHLN